MIKKIMLLILLTAVTFSCKSHIYLKNLNETHGYALGELVKLMFAANVAQYPPDSIQVFVFEKKSGFEYSLWAKKDGCDTLCSYSIMWDGRKPDGSWPMGGTYLVYAKLGDRANVFSDTAWIGMGD